MSQKSLAMRSGLLQPTISEIESNALLPNVSTLQKILAALKCKLIISALPLQNFESLFKNRARNKAQKKVEYLIRTMALEKQTPDKRLINEMTEEETQKILASNKFDLWEDNL